MVFIGVYWEAVSSLMNTEFELIFPSRLVDLEAILQDKRDV